ncbi:phytanoyl-CoA dioxygenase family protein [Marinobacter salarius]|uniref:phytanoyl-CoA dioxygenase family protein n=1 Tax=Marinobacter salarius TaxID=1420917 RepID=UPI003D9C58A0
MISFISGAAKDLYVLLVHNFFRFRVFFSTVDRSTFEVFDKGIFIKKSLIDKKSAEILKLAIDEILEKDVLVWESGDHSDARIYGFESVFDFSKVDLDIDSIRRYGETYLGNKLRYFIAVAGRLTAVDGNLGSGGGWHRDSPFRHQFKVIIYLSDVKSDRGPFQYILESHKFKEKVRFSGLGSDATRFSEDFVNGLPIKKCHEVTGSIGDAIFVDTKGIHRGKPIKSGSRYAITFYFFERLPSGHISKLTQRGATIL